MLVAFAEMLAGSVDTVGDWDAGAGAENSAEQAVAA